MVAISDVQSLAELSRLFPDAKRSGGGYRASCPAHDDGSPSLSLFRTRSGKLHVKCFAGCDTAAVLAAVGVEKPGGLPAPRPTSDAADCSQAPLAWWSQYTSVPIATLLHLPLTERGGVLAFTLGDGAPEKRRVAGSKRISWSPVGATAPSLWPPPEDSVPEAVFFSEGESDCTVLRHVGLPAYALTKGAGTPPSPDDLRRLADAGVQRAAILFDADQPGRDGSAKLAARLHDAGIVPVIMDLAAVGVLPDGGKDILDAWRFAQDRPDPAGWLRERLEAAMLPEPTSSVQVEPPWPVLHADALHGLAGDVVRAILPHSEADQVALLASFLAAAANAAGNEPHIMAGGVRHELRLWPVVVGTTAKGRKGTSWGPISEIMRRADPEWHHNGIVNGLSSGEGLAHAVRDPVVRAGDDDAVLDPGVSDKRLMVVEAEFSAPLRVMAREGSTLSATLRAGWDDGRLGVLTRNQPLRAHGAHVTVIGHAVQEEVVKYLRSSELAGGLANRFLWLAVRRSKCLPRSPGVPQHEMDALAERLRAVLDFASDCGEITWSDAAGALWDAEYEALSEGEGGLVGQVLARSEAQVLRLSAAYAVMDRCRTIEPAHLKAALAVWRYAEASARLIFGGAAPDPDADTIMAALRERGELTKTEISALFNNRAAPGRIAACLDRLMREGKIVVEKRSTGGRPTEVIRLVTPP